MTPPNGSSKETGKASLTPHPVTGCTMFHLLAQLMCYEVGRCIDRAFQMLANSMCLLYLVNPQTGSDV